MHRNYCASSFCIHRSRKDARADIFVIPSNAQSTVHTPQQQTLNMLCAEETAAGVINMRLIFPKKPCCFLAVSARLVRHMVLSARFPLHNSCTHT